jgi:hypothetical protein
MPLAARREGLDEQLEQAASCADRRPAVAVQDAVVVLEMGVEALAEDAKRGRNGPLAGREDGACDERLGVLEDAFGEQLGEWYDCLCDRRGQGEHDGVPLLAEWMLQQLTLPLVLPARSHSSNG